MTSVTFKTTIIKGEAKNTTGIRVPDEVIEQFGAGKKPPVKVELNGYTYRSTVAVMGGAYLIALSAENRAGAKVEGGDEVDITLTLDTEPRIVDLPDDLAAALAAKPGAREAFDKQNNSTRKALVNQVLDAKTQETRDRRVANIVAKLG